MSLVDTPRTLALVLSLTLVVAGCTTGDSAEETSTTVSTTLTATTTTAASTTSAQSTTSVSPKTTTTTMPSALTAALTELGLSDELMTAAVRAAEFPPCVTRSGATGEILADVEGDLGVDDMVSLQFFGDIAVIATGVLLSGIYPIVTDSDSTLSVIQSMLYMNHLRGFVAFGASSANFVTITVAKGDASSVDEWGDQLYAEWGASNRADLFGQELVTYGDDGVELVPFSWNDLVRPPVRGLAVGSDARDEAWQVVDQWIIDLEQSGAGFQALVLEPFVPGLPAIEAILCVLVTTEYERNLEQFEEHQNDLFWLQQNSEIFLDEAAVQEALLVLEYVYVVDEHMSQPDVDWGRSPSANMDARVDGITSSSEFGYVWADGINVQIAIYTVIRQEQYHPRLGN